jgi:hypothetical protein
MNGCDCSERRAERVCGEAVRLPVAAVAFDEQGCEERNVVAALAQRWHSDQEHVDPVEQVVAELACRHRGTQVDGGRRDDPDVGRTFEAVADAPHAAVLQGAVELDLHRERQLADLVEEQRSVVCLLEQPGMIGCASPL